MKQDQDLEKLGASVALLYLIQTSLWSPKKYQNKNSSIWTFLQIKTDEPLHTFTRTPSDAATSAVKRFPILRWRNSRDRRIFGRDIQKNKTSARQPWSRDDTKVEPCKNSMAYRSGERPPEKRTSVKPDLEQKIGVSP